MTKIDYENMDVLNNAMAELDNRGYLKLIYAYLKKNNKDFNEANVYLEKYTEDQFIEKLKEHYDIKGKVTFDKIAKAKIKNDKHVETEYEIQKRVCKYLNDNKLKHFSTGNGFMLGTSNNVNYMAKLKATGLKTGIPDLIILKDGKSFFLEIKRDTKYKVSEQQEKWMEWLNNNGFICKICKGFSECIDFIDNFIL